MKRRRVWGRLAHLVLSVVLVLGLLVPGTAFADEKDKGRGNSSAQAQQQKRDEEARKQAEAAAKARAEAEAKAREEARKQAERAREEARKAEEREAAKARAENERREAERREHERRAAEAERAQRASVQNVQQAQSQQSQSTRTIHVRPQTLRMSGGHDCNSNEWHFVINQIDGAAPKTITVRWANGATETLSARVTGKVAHYATTSHLNSQVVDAWTEIYSGWDGNFNLSHGPCGQQAVLGTVDEKKDDDKRDDDKKDVVKETTNVVNTNPTTPQQNVSTTSGSEVCPSGMLAFKVEQGWLNNRGGRAQFSSGPLTVTIFDFNRKTFSWSSNIGIDAVVVKSGNSARYDYASEVTSGTGLHAGTNRNGQIQDVSHILFCYDLESPTGSSGVLGTQDTTGNPGQGDRKDEKSEPLKMYGCFIKSNGTVVHESGREFGSQAEMDAYKASQGYAGIDIDRPNPDQCKNHERGEVAGLQFEGSGPTVMTTMAVAERGPEGVAMAAPSAMGEAPRAVITTAEARDQLPMANFPAAREGTLGVVSEQPAAPAAQLGMTAQLGATAQQPAQQPVAQRAGTVLPSTGEPLADLALLTLGFVGLTLLGLRFLRVGMRRA